MPARAILDRRYYVGLATTFHDPAVAIVGPDGEVLFAEATERHLQYKRAHNCEPDSLPRMAELLAAHVPDGSEVCIATSWSDRFTSYLARSAASGRFDIDRIASLDATIDGGLVSRSADRVALAALHLQQAKAGIGTAVGLQRAFGAVRIVSLRRFRHHHTHAALAAIGSPFDDATCLVVDGMGEAGSVSLFRYREGSLEEVPAQFGTVSPGFLYALLTELCGFDAMTGEEWKVMGLAPYGRTDTALACLVRGFVRLDDRGRPLRATGEAARRAIEEIEALRPRDVEHGWADLARVAQDLFSELMDGILREAQRRAPHANLVLTGGCALNSSFNGRIAGRYGFDHLHVPSAPSDDGNAVGAALLAWAEDHPGAAPALGGRPLTPYLGSTMDTGALRRLQPHEPRLMHLGDAVVERTARLLADGMLVGWVQGRAEYGPRALGNRSILADPRPATARDTINSKVKFREPFRPFAPSILEERVADWFEDPQPSPYMDRTLRWKPSVREKVPGVVHVDGTGRLQTVERAANSRFFQLLSAFEKLTDVPLLLNTSLNVMGKPIAHSTEDALMIFYTTGLDALIIDDWLLTKRPVIEDPDPSDRQPVFAGVTTSELGGR